MLLKRDPISGNIPVLTGQHSKSDEEETGDKLRLWRVGDWENG
jgi:hypothetical protein